MGKILASGLFGLMALAFMSGCDKMGSRSLGEAAPRADAAQVDFDWVLAEGGLMQGTSELEVPAGINVMMHVDNDLADTLVVEGYEIEFPLAADSLVNVNFFTHKKGRFSVRLKSGKNALGHIKVVDPQ